MSDTFKFVQSQATTLAGAGISIGATSIILSSFLQIDGSTTLTMTNFGTLGFGTIEPGGGVNEEQISFTGITQNSNGTATLTGVSTVLFIDPYTQTSGTAKSHAGGVTFVISNTAGFYNQLTSKGDDETISGIWTFTAPNYPRMDSAAVAPTDDVQIATKKYVDDTAFAGAPDASTTVKGIVEEATQAEVDAKTAAGGTSARLFLNPTTQRSTQLSDYVASDTGSANAYAIAPSPAITAYAAGQVFTFKATNANTTTSTLAVSGLASPKTIKKLGNTTDLVANDILAGQIVCVEYDGTVFQMISNSGKNFVDLATNQTIAAGTKTFTVLPQSSAVPGTGNDLTNKTYVDGAPRFTFKNGIATRTDTTASGSQTIAHGLARTPAFVRLTAVLQAVTAAAGANGNQMSVGTYNGTTTACVYSIPLNSENGNVTAEAGNDSTNIIVLKRNKGGSLASQVATITVDGTNITLAWTLAGTMAGNTISIMWEVQ